MMPNWYCNINKCGKPAYHRVTKGKLEFLRCPKHLDKYLGLTKPKQSKYKTINDFAVTVCQYEGLKVGVNIAQVKEILKIINRLLDGRVYKWIKK